MEAERCDRLLRRGNELAAIDREKTALMDYEKALELESENETYQQRVNSMKNK